MQKVSEILNEESEQIKKAHEAVQQDCFAVGDALYKNQEMTSPLLQKAVQVKSEQFKKFLRGHVSNSFKSLTGRWNSQMAIVEAVRKKIPSTAGVPVKLFQAEAALRMVKAAERILFENVLTPALPSASSSSSSSSAIVTSVK